MIIFLSLLTTPISFKITPPFIEKNLIISNNYCNSITTKTDIINTQPQALSVNFPTSHNNFKNTEENKYYSINKPLYNENIITCEPAGINGFYSLGVSYYLKKNYNLSEFVFAGASAGSWNCLLLAMKEDNNTRLLIEKILTFNQHNIRGTNFQKIAKLQDNLQDLILDSFTEDNFNLNKIYIGVSFLRGFTINAELIYNFSSLMDITECCKASSHIPLVTANLIKRYKGIIAFDGGLRNLPLSLVNKSYFNIHTDMWGTVLEDSFNIEKDIKYLFYKGYIDSHENRRILDKKFKKKKY